MFDLALTEKGDLIFQQNINRAKPLKIQFSLTSTKTLRISFQTRDFNPITNNTGIKISFNIGSNQYKNKAITLNNIEAKIQAIKIRLQTSLGDISGRPNIGSALEFIKHKSLTDISTHSQTVSIVKTAIEDIVKDPKVIVKPVVSKRNGKYSQKLVIYIYENDILIYKYGLRG